MRRSGTRRLIMPMVVGEDKGAYAVVWMPFSRPYLMTRSFLQ